MPLLDWTIHLLEMSGYAGVTLIMLAAELVLFVPSEIITPLAGFVSVRFGLSFWGVVLAATTGSVIGGLPWYFLGRRMQQRGLAHWLNDHRRILGISTRPLRRAEQWFAKHRELAVLMARLLPGIRPLIGIPAGASRMRLTRFLTYSTGGTLVWTIAWVLVGRLLEEEIHRAGHMTVLVVGALVLLVVVGYGVWSLFRRLASEAS